MDLTRDYKRARKLRSYRKIIEEKLKTYGSGIDFGVKERFVDFGNNTVLIILKKETVNVTRTTKYEEIENIDNTSWLREMVESFPQT